MTENGVAPESIAMGCVIRLLGLAPLALAALVSPAFADEQDGQTWLNYTVQGPVSGKLLILGEAQARFGEDSSRIVQSIIRPGIGYQLTPKASVWVGYGHITNHRPGPDQLEQRLWQQVSYNFGAVAGGALSTRSRLEQRVVDKGGDDTAWRVRHLVRYERKFRQGGDPSLVLTSEAFLAVNDADWGPRSGLDQWRNFAGAGFTVAPKTRFEVGYLNQFINRPGDNERMNHVASVTLITRL